MKRILLASVLLLLCAGTLSALIGYSESDIFAITAETLPVELSTFTATITAQHFVRLSWITQSETNLRGYYVYRSANSQLSASVQVSGLISPTNTSSQQIYSFVDSEIYQSGQYYYWLYSLEIDGSGTYHGPISIQMELGDQSGLPAIPLQTGLRSIYPNPFNPNTTISYQLENSGQVEMSIYNTRGQIVQSFSRHHATPGYYTLQFDGKDSSGNSLSSGVYHVVMTAGKQVSNQKTVLLK